MFSSSPLCVQDQFEQHVRANVKLNVYLYYGSDRNRSKKFLSSQDVVITTYNVLSADFGVSVEPFCSCKTTWEAKLIWWCKLCVDLFDEQNPLVATNECLSWTWTVFFIMSVQLRDVLLNVGTQRSFFKITNKCLFAFQNKSPLHGINWLRVVLDEGHIIRNPNAQMSKAVLDLKAQRRWILSGITAPYHTHRWPNI